MSLQKLNVFLLERLPTVMRRLVVDVLGDTIQMRMRNGKRTKAFLPGKPAADPILLVDVIGRSRFDVADQI